MSALPDLHDVLCQHQTYMMCYVSTIRPTLCAMSAPSDLHDVLCQHHQTYMMCYVSTIRPTLCAMSAPSDLHGSVSQTMLLEYKQRMVQEAIVTRELQRWSDQSEASRRLGHVPIQFQVRSFRNQQPWVGGSIRNGLFFPVNILIPSIHVVCIIVFHIPLGIATSFHFTAYPVFDK